jgi:hypothetical protein
MLSILLLLGVSCWCWFGNGPYFLRWPAVIMVVLLTSGHPLAAVFGPELEQLAAPLLALFFAVLGLAIILRGLFGFSGRRYHHGYHDYHGRYGRRWRGDRW